MSTETSPFASVEREFQHLARRPEMEVPGNWIGCAEPLTLPAFRDRLLCTSVGYDARDVALCNVAARARDNEQWMVALIGVLLPGLRRAVHPMAASCPNLAADVESESLAALVEAVRNLPADATYVAARLVNSAAFRANRFVGAELALRAHCEPTADLTVGSDDGGGLLAAAVLEGAISASDAQLIAETRLGGVSLAEYAAEHAISYDRAQKRRAAAESALREWQVDGATQKIPATTQELPAEIGP